MLLVPLPRRQILSFLEWALCLSLLIPSAVGPMLWWHKWRCDWWRDLRKQIAWPSLDILQAFSRKALGAKQADIVKVPLVANGQLGAFQSFLILSSHSLVDYVHIPIWERAQAMPPTIYVLCSHSCLSFCEP